MSTEMNTAEHLLSSLGFREPYVATACGLADFRNWRFDMWMVTGCRMLRVGPLEVGFVSSK